MSKGGEQLVLAHFLMRSDHKINPQYGVRESWTDNYSVQRLFVNRPQKGRKLYCVQCNYCQKVVDLKVSNELSCRLSQTGIAVVLGVISIFIPLVLILFIPAFICIFLKPAPTAGISLIDRQGAKHRHEIKMLMGDGKLR
jgi:hypothetical protein